MTLSKLIWETINTRLYQSQALYIIDLKGVKNYDVRIQLKLYLTYWNEMICKILAILKMEWHLFTWNQWFEIKLKFWWGIFPLKSGKCTFYTLETGVIQQITLEGAHILATDNILCIQLNSCLFWRYLCH